MSIKDKIKFYYYSFGSVKECLDWNEKAKTRKLISKIQYEYILKANALTKLRIFGNYTHCAEALIRGAQAIKDKSLNLWASYSNDGKYTF
mgnify:CR=1 FL=1